MPSRRMVPILTILLLGFATAIGHVQPQDNADDDASVRDKPYTPRKGSQERKAILDAFRGEAKRSDPSADVVYVVTHLKVHHGWAWAEVNPQSPDGTQHFESEQALLHNTGGVWKVVDRVAGWDLKYVKRMKSKHPAMPLDIFPPPE